MPFVSTLGHHRYVFQSLRQLMAKATPLRSGDRLSGVAAVDLEENMAARLALADVPLQTFLSEAIVPYEEDDVTRLIIDTHDAEAFKPIASLTVGDFRDWLLEERTDSAVFRAVAPGVMPEMAAAVSKIMRNQDLIQVAGRCRVVTKFRNTIGLPRSLAVRIQPNHPSDDPAGILASIVDGLMYGCGDAVIGVNPVSDNLGRIGDLLSMVDEIIRRFDIPTQGCILTHVTNTLELIARGAPVDLVFQSVSGTQMANASFGATLPILREAQEAALSLKRGTIGNNVMYFETGQGSALSAQAHHDADQQTIEARAYGVCRAFDPLLVNTVVGFIGPEYLLDGKQIIRAGLEDHFCGKLLGLPMGCDICFTNHSLADQDDIDTLLTLLGTSGVNFIMGVPGGDDVMLNYQSTSYHDQLYIRELLGLRRAPEFETWLHGMAITDERGRLRASPTAGRLLDYAKMLADV